MTMRKIQVFLREDQRAALRSIAARTGQKQSDLIRKSVDLLIERAQREDIDWREATRAIAGMWKDRPGLEDLSREIRAAAKRRFAFVYERT
ncbi:hypothetical protein [Pelomicrobium methylotrophicum]|uniref:Ribbon-helix-helix protein CopG domain-containing protein n=1 Tax=Pelomicrobium methylotrophicum TaxID=2602750 RepID=A0A5C7EX74_9PROT|nr:hypothetical protein [Pelomicrobium methylotrophicum]TXF13013.1 hypothetical protein FR698_02740 [Pelomicrobium methylotrophicum]